MSVRDDSRFLGHFEKGGGVVGRFNQKKSKEKGGLSLTVVAHSARPGPDNQI